MKTINDTGFSSTESRRHRRVELIKNYSKVLKTELSNALVSITNKSGKKSVNQEESRIEDNKKNEQSSFYKSAEESAPHIKIINNPKKEIAKKIEEPKEIPKEMKTGFSSESSAISNSYFPDSEHKPLVISPSKKATNPDVVERCIGSHVAMTSKGRLSEIPVKIPAKQSPTLDKKPDAQSSMNASPILDKKAKDNLDNISSSPRKENRRSLIPVPQQIKKSDLKQSEKSSISKELVEDEESEDENYVVETIVDTRKDLIRENRRKEKSLYSTGNYA